MKIPYTSRRGKKGVFVYRRRVPTALQATVGTDFWKISLGTTDERAAMSKAAALVTEHNTSIEAAANEDAVVNAQRGYDAAVQRRERQRRDGREDGAVWAGRPVNPSQQFATDLKARRDQLVNDAAARMLDEAAERIGVLPPDDQERIRKAGGLHAYHRHVLLNEAVHSLHVDVVSPYNSDWESSDGAEQEDSAMIAKATLAAEGEVLRTKRRVLERLKVRAVNDETEDANNPRIQSVIEQWLKHKGQRHAAAHRHRVSVRRFVELHGNLPVREITQQHVLEYRAFCEKIPDTRGMTPAAKRGDVGSLKNKNGRVIASKTVERHLSSIKALLRWCTTNVPNFGILNVAQGITAAKDKRRRQEVARGFTPVQMRLIFDNINVVYDVTRKRYQQRAVDMGWLVRVGAYTGARLEELAQLTRMDVRKIGDVWVIDINEDSGRRLKNENSVRMIPVHPELLKLGFIEWARNGDGKRVFRSFKPLPARQEGTCGHSASSGFGRFLDAIGLPERFLNFHSFRHTFITAMRNARVTYAAELAISGHADKLNPVHGNYGSAAYVKVLFEEIGKVDPMGDALA